jgi:hypothetical protein
MPKWLRIIYERVAGLDVHKKTVVATRMRVTEDQGKRRKRRRSAPPHPSCWNCTTG